MLYSGPIKLPLDKIHVLWACQKSIVVHKFLSGSHQGGFLGGLPASRTYLVFPSEQEQKFIFRQARNLKEGELRWTSRALLLEAGDIHLGIKNLE